jgi:DNA repair protein RadC
MKIKDLPKVDMPREKLEKYGTEKMLDHELLAILLGSGIKGLNVLELSKKILSVIAKVGVDKISLEDLLQVKGLGKAKASEIISCFELGRRILKGKKTAILLSPKDVWERMEDVRSSKKEHFVVFYLDSRSQEIQREVISIGTLNESLVHPREVFEPAIKNSTASIILSHNHPSGDTEPSEADIEITKKLIHAGKILDINIVDHVIVTSKSFLSIINSK